MTAHYTNWGLSLPPKEADRDGFIRFSPCRAAACLRAMLRGQAPPAWAATGNNPLIAELDLDLAHRRAKEHTNIAITKWRIEEE